MRSFRFLLPLAMLLAACSPKARIDCTVADAPLSDIELRLLDVNVYKVLDTVQTDASGQFRYALEVQEGQPEFVYLFRGPARLASLLLSAGETAVVTADTLGNYSVEGSPESARLAEVEKSMAAFARKMNSDAPARELSAAYIAYYRECTRYVMQNAGSLTVVPVLFQQLDENSPVFSQHTDAILFRHVVDTLKTVYPESRYVKGLEKETVRRENAMKMESLLQSAVAAGYPNLVLPDVNGQKVQLSSLDSKAVLLHFWDSSDAAQKMFNLDKLLPLYNRWSGRGLQIYAVDVNPDKAEWASVMKSQNLPWINVNDGLGAASSAVMLYNVGAVPASFLLAGGELAATVSGEKALEQELLRILK